MKFLNNNKKTNLQNNIPNIKINKNKLKFKHKILFILILFLFFFIFSFNNFFSLISYANETTFAKNNYSRASMDIDGNIYMKENLYKRIYPASMTKIAISIIAIEKLDLKEKIKIKESTMILPLDYVVTPLYIGETLTVEDLLYATMLKSGNDAPIQLAKHIYGDEKNFKKEINKYLKNLGLTDTNFTNPFGLEDKNHYTTPYDLLTLARYAMKNETFRKIVSTNKYIIPENSYSYKRIIETTSLFTYPNSSVYSKDFYGIKTGFTETAGDCFISAAKINDKEFYFIYTGAKSKISKFKEIQKMYDETKYLFEQKNIINEYIETVTNEKILKETNSKYIFQKFLLTTFDKIILILLFSLLIIIILFKSRNLHKRKR